MKSWYDIYKERMNERYSAHIKEKYKPFIDELNKADGYHYVELGCGAGNITKMVRQYHLYKNFTLIDSCPKMLSLAIENNPIMNCNFVCADVTKNINIPLEMDRTVIHSHGLLEHFNDEEICRIVALASNYAKTQIHYVPGAKYEKPSRGDERLMTKQDWHSILVEIDRPLTWQISEFNSGYDFIIKLERS